jgi:hypothetical protein
MAAGCEVMQLPAGSPGSRGRRLVAARSRARRRVEGRAGRPRLGVVQGLRGGATRWLDHRLRRDRGRCRGSWWAGTRRARDASGTLLLGRLDVGVVVVELRSAGSGQPDIPSPSAEPARFRPVQPVAERSELRSSGLDGFARRSYPWRDCGPWLLHMHVAAARRMGPSSGVLRGGSMRTPQAEAWLERPTDGACIRYATND